MEQYIPKSTFVAEIEKRRDAALMRQHNLEAIGQETVINKIVANELNRIISFIDNLEVKEVQEEPVSGELEEEITRYFSKNPIKHLTDWPALKNTALHFANWQKEQKNIWHTMDENPNYPCDILFLTDVDSMFLYRYMENGRPVDNETPYFHNILKGKCWCYCNDIINIH